MGNLSKSEVVKIMGKAINQTMNSPCNVSVELTTSQQYKISLEGFPLYPSGYGYLILCFPQDAFRVDENNNIIPREISQNEIRIFNGKSENSTKALLHTNIFNDGHPCLGGGASRVIIRDLNSLATYFIGSALRVNMTGQSFCSPANNKHGQTREEMDEFKQSVRAMLSKKLSSFVLSLDMGQIATEFHENFNDLYRAR